MNVRFVIDSTVNIPERYREDVLVVPLTVHFGNDEYADGVEITNKRFYEMLIESDVLPTTSQPSPDAFFRAFKEAAGDRKKVIAITVASKLSGTYQSAKIAAMDFPEGEVFVVDSSSVAMGAGILAEYGIELAKKGADAAEIVTKLNEEKKNIRLIALLDTLEYLKKGGRISKTAAAFGGVLSIKPVLSVADGELSVIGKARGSKKGNNLLIENIKKDGGVDFKKPVYLGYTGLSDELLQKYIADSSCLWEGNVEELDVASIGSVIGTHAGPGAIAVAYFKK